MTVTAMHVAKVHAEVALPTCRAIDERREGRRDHLR